MADEQTMGRASGLFLFAKSYNGIKFIEVYRNSDPTFCLLTDML